MQPMSCARRQLLSPVSPQGLDRELRGGDRGKTDDRPKRVDGHIGRAYVMAELVLACVANEEPVEVWVARAETRAVVVWLQPRDGEPRWRLSRHRRSDLA